MEIGNTKVIQVTNIAPQATRDQMHTLFAHLGKIEEVRLYPSVRDASISVTSRVCFLKFFDGDHVPVALHMTNTVFIDRAIIVQPFTNGDIPDELCGLEMANSALPRGVNESKLPPYVTNEVEGDVVKTYDPKLESTGLPHYPALPASSQNSAIEEIRRTIVVIGLDSTTTAQQCMEYFASEAGEVKYFRYCTRDNDPVKYALIEFTDHGAVIPAFRLNNTILGTACIQVYHATQAIVKPQAKTNEAAQKEIEEAMKKVKKAQNLVSAAVDPLMGMLGVPRGGRNTMDRSRSRSMDRGYGGYSRDKRRRRSRSRSRDRRRSRSRSRGDRRRRSRSRERRRRSRSRSRGDRRRRSRSREKKRRSRTRSKDRKKRSKSRDKKEKKKEEEPKVKTEEEAKPVGEENGAAAASEAATVDKKEDGAVTENGGNEEGNGNAVEDPKEEKKERSKSRSKERKRSRSRERKRSRSRDRRRSRSRSRTKKSKRDRSRSRDRRRRSRSKDRRRRSRSKSHDRDHKHKKSKKNKRDKSVEKEKRVDDKKIARDYDEEEEGFENRAEDGSGRVKEEKLEAVDMEISNSP